MTSTGLPTTESAHDRILTETDLPRLERWLERAAAATSIAEVIDEPS